MSNVLQFPFSAIKRNRKVVTNPLTYRELEIIREALEFYYMVFTPETRARKDDSNESN